MLFAKYMNKINESDNLPHNAKVRDKLNVLKQVKGPK